jgi:phosphoglycolate phosphatase
MIGDSSFDLQMARHAGVDSVAVGYGAQSLATLREHGPKLAIEDFAQLRAWLERGAGELRIEVGDHVG